MISLPKTQGTLLSALTISNSTELSPRVTQIMTLLIRRMMYHVRHFTMSTLLPPTFLHNYRCPLPK